MFCDKCSEILEEDEKCGRCEKNNFLDLSSLDLSPVCLGFLPTEETFGRTIMAMGQLFNDQRRRWEGYWIYFYSDEFIPPNPKPLNLLHIHFKGQNGEIRVYLSPEKYLDIDEKWGIVPKHERTKIIKFVERNKQEIMDKLENELRKIGAKNK